MLLQNRIERTIEQLRGRCSAPVRIELWNGQGFDLAENPSVVLRVTFDLDGSSKVFRVVVYSIRMDPLPCFAWAAGRAER